MRHPRTIWLALGALVWLDAALAQAPRANAPSAEEVQQRLADAKARLNLTPDQEEQLRPLLEEEGAKLRDIQAKYGGTTSRQERRAALGEVRAVQQDFRAKVAGILTPEQLAEWDEMRGEARERLRQRRQQ
jgi:hypothetical protein